VIRSHASTAIIDMSGVSYLDTSGIATLVEASQIAHERTVGLRLVGLTGQPRMLAGIADIARIFRAMGSEVEIS
jgi:anti-sigma B factor antagonist